MEELSTNTQYVIADFEDGERWIVSVEWLERNPEGWDSWWPDEITEVTPYITKKHTVDEETWGL